MTAKVDLIIANGTQATLAAKNATTTIPILMWGAADPVGSGLVNSLARPGGNVTGMALLSAQMGVKRLAIIRELLPGIRRVAEITSVSHPAIRANRQALEDAYRAYDMNPVFLETERYTQLDELIAEAVRGRAQALHFVNDVMRASWLVQVFRAAIAASLPTMVADSEHLEAGALISYDVEDRDTRLRAAAMFDKLLRGAKPADLPVEQPTKFSLGINLRTARVLKVAVPSALLLRADKLVE